MCSALTAACQKEHDYREEEEEWVGGMKEEQGVGIISPGCHV